MDKINIGMHRVFKFGDFVADTRLLRLTFRNETVSLTPKAFQTLVLLLRNHGTVVEKEVFLNEVWADTFVEESTLAQNILTLRKMLRRYQQDKEFIVTVPRQGYQFVEDVDDLDAPDRNGGTPKATSNGLSSAAPAPQEYRTASPATASGSTFLTERRSRGTIVAISLLACLTVGIAYFAFASARAETLADTQFRTFRTDTIVADADIRNSAISPNGKYLSLLQVKNGIQSLYVRQIENGNTTELVSEIRGRFTGPVFSPSGDEIYYSVQETAGDGSLASALYQVPVLGGVSKKITSGVNSPIAISPSGTHIAFIRQPAEGVESSIVIADASGANERYVAKRPSASGFTTRALSWSPNGKVLAASALRDADKATSAEIVFADVESGAQKIVTNAGWTSAGDTIWLRDGSGVATVVYGAKSPGLNDELWIISYPAGTTRMITAGINGDYGISFDAATNSIVGVTSQKFACFLTAPVDDLFKNTHVLTTISDQSTFPFGGDWTNDGKIVYSAADEGNVDIFTLTEDGRERKQLTSGAAAEISPKLSADGRVMVFVSNRTGQMDVWRADGNGTNERQLTTSGSVTEVTVSPDGKTALYLMRSPDSSSETLWRVSTDGGSPVQLTKGSTRSPRVSPDGRSIACYTMDIRTNTMKVSLVSMQTGTVERSISMPDNDDIPFVDWSKDGKDLFAVLRRGKPTSLWRIPINGGPPQQLREWENDTIFRLAISRTGDRIFYEVGNELNTVVRFKSLEAGVD